MSWYEPKPARAELRATVLEDFVAALPVTTSRREFADATVTYLARNPRASQAELGSFLGLNPRQTYRRCTYGMRLRVGDADPNSAVSTLPCGYGKRSLSTVDCAGRNRSWLYRPGPPEPRLPSDYRSNTKTLFG